MNESKGKLKFSEKTCPRAALPSTHLTWLDRGSNPGLAPRRLTAWDDMATLEPVKSNKPCCNEII
jgi:hypothetical protein